jgi:hypothetical protein
MRLSSVLLPVNRQGQAAGCGIKQTPAALEVDHHEIAAAVASVIRPKSPLVAIQKHGQGDPTDGPCPSPDTTPEPMRFNPAPHC